MTTGSPWFPRRFLDITQWRSRQFLQLLMTGRNWIRPIVLGCLLNCEGSRVCEPQWISVNHKDGSHVPVGWEKEIMVTAAGKGLGTDEWNLAFLCCQCFHIPNLRPGTPLSGSEMNTLRGEVPILCAVFFNGLGWHNIQTVFHCQVVAQGGTRKRLFYINIFFFPPCFQLGLLSKKQSWQKETTILQAVSHPKGPHCFFL